VTVKSGQTAITTAHSAVACIFSHSFEFIWPANREAIWGGDGGRPCRGSSNEAWL